LVFQSSESVRRGASRLAMPWEALGALEFIPEKLLVVAHQEPTLTLLLTSWV
jgi:hypothetical protein